MIRLIIAGSRSFNDYTLLEREALSYIGDEKNVTIISGLAKGADTLACDFAAKHGFPLEGFAAQWRKNGYYDRSAGIKRNKLMAKNATHLLAFWDYESKGTQHMIDFAIDEGLKVKVIKYEN